MIQFRNFSIAIRYIDTPPQYSVFYIISPVSQNYNVKGNNVTFFTTLKSSQELFWNKAFQ